MFLRREGTRWHVHRSGEGVAKMETSLLSLGQRLLGPARVLTQGTLSPSLTDRRRVRICNTSQLMFPLVSSKPQSVGF